jgi:hypothetical protein
MSGYQPSEVFAVLLEHLDGRLFKVGDIIKLHRLFYDLARKNPVHMAKFKFLKRANPDCLTLHDLIKWFDMAGVLCWAGMENMTVDRLQLKKFLPAGDSAYSVRTRYAGCTARYKDFDGLDALVEL